MKEFRECFRVVKVFIFIRRIAGICILDSYNQNAAMMEDIAISYPENFLAAMETLGDYKQMMQDKALGGYTLDPNVQYFFAEHKPRQESGEQRHQHSEPHFYIEGHFC